MSQPLAFPLWVTVQSVRPSPSLGISSRKRSGLRSQRTCSVSSSWSWGTCRSQVRSISDSSGDNVPKAKVLEGLVLVHPDQWAVDLAGSTICLDVYRPRSAMVLAKHSASHQYSIESKNWSEDTKSLDNTTGRIPRTLHLEILARVCILKLIAE